MGTEPLKVKNMKEIKLKTGQKELKTPFTIEKNDGKTIGENMVNVKWL